MTSDEDTKGLIWLLEANGVKDVPSLHQVKESKKHIREVCGVRTVHYKGDLGHPYYVNSISDLIRLVSLIYSVQCSRCRSMTFTDLCLGDG